MTKARILVVDDEQAMCDLLADDLKRRDFAPTTSKSPIQALDLVRQDTFDVVLTDLKMPRMDGLQFCREVVQIRPDLPVIVMTAFGSMDTAIEAIRAGAYDFVTKPIEMQFLAIALSRAAKHRELQSTIKRLSEDHRSKAGFGDLLGESEPMKRLYDQLNRIAESDAAVLVTGESGSGKELVARAVHERSNRQQQPFVAVNCAALPEALLESELFGHVRGAFTDARTDRKGLFVEADGGTLFLDELGEMPLGMQTKLLRVLEERKVRPVGGTQEVPFDVRIVSATNRDLETAVEEKAFREDLFYRINVVQLELPPLRSRGTDILLLAQHFIERFAERSNKEVDGLSEPVAEKLLSYNWPGNVRELRNVMERAVALTRFDKLTVDDLPDKIRQFKSSQVVLVGDDPAELLPLGEIEARYIQHVLKATEGNKTMAAKILGLDRKTLYRKLKENV